jgi:Zn finger protein HypA/HybF involved in hydrogenase expression
MITLQCEERKMIFKCTQCGNTFTNEVPVHDDVLTCPICDAQYLAVVKLGKIQLKDYVFEENDLEQL